MNKKYTPFEWLLVIVLLIGMTLLLLNGLSLRAALIESGFMLAAVSLVLLLRSRGSMKVAGCAAVLAVLQCLIIYFWYESAGTMKLIPSTYYYDLQANAFLHGQLALLEKPAAELQTLADPYDPAQNAPYRHLHDAAYYKGKYFLYWGPFPALVLAIPKLLSEIAVSDAVLVLVFMSGYVVFLALNLFMIRTIYFPALPAWTLVPAILVGGLMNPTLWLLARPAVYEAAISGGQCCALGGFYFAFSALHRNDMKLGKWIVSGILLAGATLSRISLALAIVWAASCIAYAIHKRSQSRRQVQRVLLAFGTPLVVAGLLFFSYNFLRFDSPFEVGMKYTLGGMNTMKMAEDGFLASPRNIPSNLKTYLFFRMTRLAEFPFVTAPSRGFDAVNEAMSSHGLKSYAVSENVAGIMRTSPVFWCLVAQILFVAAKFFFKTKASTPVPYVSTRWPSVLFVGFGVLAILPPSLSFTSSMRYIFDFAPMVLLVTYMRLALLQNNIPTKFERVSWGTALTVLCALTMGYGMLLGITSYYDHFSSENPALYNQLSRTLSFIGR